MSRIDAEQVQSLYRQGYSLRQVAEMVGCSYEWVRALVNPKARERLDRHTRAYLKSGVCPECGGQMTLRHHQQKVRGKLYQRCIACHRAKVKADQLAYQVDAEGNLWCYACHQYHPPEEFPSAMRVRDYGSKRRCTRTDSAARRAYRERRKVPCTRCGKLRLPKAESSPGFAKRHFGDSGLCRECYTDVVLRGAA